MPKGTRGVGHWGPRSRFMFKQERFHVKAGKKIKHHLIFKRADDETDDIYFFNIYISINKM